MAGRNAREYLPPAWRTAQWFLIELNMYLPYDPAAVPLDVYLMELLFTQKTSMNVNSSFIYNSPNLKQA